MMKSKTMLLVSLITLFAGFAQADQPAEVVMRSADIVVSECRRANFSVSERIAQADGSVELIELYNYTYTSEMFDGLLVFGESSRCENARNEVRLMLAHNEYVSIAPGYRHSLIPAQSNEQQ